jgi:hypothetical protein
MVILFLGLIVIMFISKSIPVELRLEVGRSYLLNLGKVG